MPRGDESLIQGVRRLSPPIYPMVYPRTRAEVVQRYQQDYGNDWKSHIVTAIVDQTGKSRKNVSREFQLNKRTGEERYKGSRVTKATAAKYEALGKTLKPTPDTSKPPKYRYPPGGMKISFNGMIQISRKWKPASFTIFADENGLGFDEYRSSPEHAADFLANPNGWDVMWAYFLGDQAVEDYDGTFFVR
jgi:hypothetical protein